MKLEYQSVAEHRPPGMRWRRFAFALVLTLIGALIVGSLGFCLYAFIAGMN